MSWAYQTSSVSVNHLVETIHESISTQNIFSVQIGAHRFATDITRYIKDINSWSLTHEQIEKFSEFFVLLLLDPTYRNAALSLIYKPNEAWLDFSFYINGKLVQDKKKDGSVHNFHHEFWYSPENEGDISFHIRKGSQTQGLCPLQTLGTLNW